MYKVNEIKNTLYDNKISKKYAIKLERLKEGEKISIVADTMFNAMFQTLGREKYACWLISLFTNYSYEELLNNLVYEKNELDKVVANKKGLRCDFVGDINGTKINVEINNNSSIETMERNLEYLFRLYSSNVTSDTDYNYHTSIQLNLNNYAFEGNDEIIDIYTLQNDKGTKLTNKLIIVQIYLPNLRKKWYTYGVEGLNEAEKYLLTLIETNINDSLELGKGIDIMEDYVKEAVNVSGNEVLLEAYDKEWALKDEGKREGYEEGFDEGVEFGIEQNRTEMVKNMLNENMDINSIAKVTGLSLEEIIEIKNRME